MSRPKPSKSEKKREMLALQELGVRLLSLSDEQIDVIEMDEELKEAVRKARGMTAHGALRRQKQLIGKIMRHIDPVPIRDKLDALGRQKSKEKTLFRDAEHWRDRIAGEGNAAVAAFAAETGRDTSKLSDLSAELARTDHVAGRKKIRREIFREVRDLLASEMQNDAP